MSVFQCSCSAAFATTSQLEDHIQAEQTRDFQDRQLCQRLIQRLEQSLSHSKAECDIRTPGINDADAPDESEGTEKLIAKRPVNRLKKHKDREGYHCPLEECDVKPVDKLAILRDHYATHIEHVRPCPICHPFKSRTMIEWIRHVKRHDNLESEVDKTFIREKIIELYRRVDEELVWAHPKPQASRTQRSQKRTREATEIDSDQPRSQQPKRIRRAITTTHDEQARQEDLFSPHIPSGERVIASGNEITDYTSIETSYTAGAFSSLPYSIPDDHNAQATPSQCIDLIPLPGQMASLGPDSAFMNSQHMPNGPSQNINSYPTHLQEFPLPDQLALYMPPIFRALNYPQ